MTPHGLDMPEELRARLEARAQLARDGTALRQLQDDLLQHAEAVQRARDAESRGTGLVFYGDTPLPYQELIAELDGLLEAAEAPPGWTDPDDHYTVASLLGDTLIEEDSQWMLPRRYGGIPTWRDAAEMLRAWRTPDGELSTWQGFFDAFHVQACADWSKMDERGESYGGAWKAPEDSDEHKQAWDLCRERNARALFAMPYPKHALLWSVEYGCGFRRESVPFSKMLCEWTARKLAHAGTT